MKSTSDLEDVGFAKSFSVVVEGLCFACSYL
jgi:hypothetical protein